MEIQSIITVSIVLTIALGFFGLTAALSTWLKRHLNEFENEVKDQDKKAVVIEG